MVSGLSSSKVSVCRMLIKESAEARLGGMIEHSLLKTNLKPHLNQATATWGSQIHDKVLANTSPSALSEIGLLSLKSTSDHPLFSGVRVLF